MPQCETPKYQTIDLTPFRSSGYRELEVSKHFITEMPKCEMPKYQTVDLTPFRSSRYRELECRNTSPQECRNAKNTFWCKFWIPGVGVSKHFTTGMSKCRNAKNTFWCRLWSPSWSCESRGASTKLSSFSGMIVT
jgi:hypothetical protein